MRQSTTLSTWLRLGALWDWLMAAAILLATPSLMRWLRFPPPESPFLFHLSAMPPLFFGLVYWLVARDPEGRHWGVRLAIALRLFGGLMLGILTILHRPGGSHLYGATAVIDLLWGALWIVLLRAPRLPAGKKTRWRRGTPTGEPPAFADGYLFLRIYDARGMPPGTVLVVSRNILNHRHL